MPRKKKPSFGPEIDAAMEVMSKLANALKAFHDPEQCPLKAGLESNNLEKEHEEEIVKLYNAASEEATALMNKVHDLRKMVSSIRMNRNSRFARQVVANFLEEV
jgi:hypothetical protein